MADTFSISDQARADLKEIWAYIARDNIGSADNVLEEFYNAFSVLAECPLIGHHREDITSRSVRFWSVYSYLIIYDPNSKPIRILHVMSGYRDLKNLLDDEL